MTFSRHMNFVLAENSGKFRVSPMRHPDAPPRHCRAGLPTRDFFSKLRQKTTIHATQASFLPRIQANFACRIFVVPVCCHDEVPKCTQRTPSYEASHPKGIILYASTSMQGRLCARTAIAWGNQLRRKSAALQPATTKTDCPKS